MIIEETTTPQQLIIENNSEKITISETGLLMLPENHPDYFLLLQLQLENQELMQWKSNLQSRINSERTELVRLRQLLAVQIQNPEVITTPEPSTFSTDPTSPNGSIETVVIETDAEFERVITHLMKENSLLEQKRNLLACEIFEETNELIQLQVDLDLQKYRT